MGRDLTTIYTDPYVANSFGVALQYGTQTIAMFSTVSGGAQEIKVIKYTLNTNGGRSGLRMPGPSSNEPVTLSFGVTADVTFWTWFADMKGNTRNRQHLSIFAYGRMDSSTGTKFYAQWDLNYAWPCKISGLNFDLDSDAAFITEVTLMHEGITRVL